jgi:hypothetical protein
MVVDNVETCEKVIQLLCAAMKMPPGETLSAESKILVHNHLLEETVQLQVRKSALFCYQIWRNGQLTSFFCEAI